MFCSFICWFGFGSVGGVCCTWFIMRVCVGCFIIGDIMVVGLFIGEIIDLFIWEGGGGVMIIFCWGL